MGGDMRDSPARNAVGAGRGHRASHADLLGLRPHDRPFASLHDIGKPPPGHWSVRMSRPLPTIHGVTEKPAGFYKAEQLDLEFSNGERRQFERMLARGHGAVVVVPMLDDQTVLLVREYAAGVHRYELGLVKGRIDAGETALEAADRELKEEAGYGARRLDALRQMTLAPTYMNHQSWLVVARDLYPEKLPGDEPEEMEVVPWKLDALHELMLRDDFSEGRSLAALFIAREWLKNA
jgi:ADP-ribose diphosphatase